MKPAELIARAITRERERAALSLSALAAKAGLAKSTLSQLESGNGNPSIETLWALAAALEIPFSHLFEVASPDATLIRAGEGALVTDAASEISAVLLSDCPPARRRDLYRMTFRNGAARQADAHPKGVVEHAFLCAGRMRVGPAGREEALNAGDYYRYPADVPHRYEALSETATLLLVMEDPG